MDWYKVFLALDCAITAESYLHAVALYARELKVLKLPTVVASQRPARAQELA